MTVIDAVTSKLGILTSGSPVYSQWGTTKQNMLNYLTCLTRQRERRRVHDSLCEVGNQLIFELSQMLPMDIVRLIFYAQNVEVLLGFTAAGDMLDDKAVSTYLTCSGRLVESAFSDEYTKTNEEVREILGTACHRSCSDEEFDKLCLLSRWQSENFLSHLNPSALDVNDSRPALLSMMSEGHLDVVDFMGDQLAAAGQTHATDAVVPSLDPDSDGEEKVDVSEKHVDRENSHLELESRTEGFQRDDVCEVADPVEKQQVCSASQEMFAREIKKDSSLGRFLVELSSTRHIGLSALLPLVSSLEGLDEISLAGDQIAVLVEELTSQISIVEKEICDIEAALSEAALSEASPAIVLQTLHSALPGRQRDLARLSKNLTELQEIKKVMDSTRATSRCAGLMNLDIADLRNALKGCLVCPKQRGEMLAQLMACVVDLYLVTDDELQQLFRLRCRQS